MENHPGPIEKGSRPSRLGSRWSLQTVVPWLGAGFWVFLWLWIVLSSPEKADDGSPILMQESAGEIGLHGLTIRQTTLYSDDKFTWMDLSASSGHNVEGSADAHLLYDVVVKVVVDSRKKTAAEGDEGLSDLSRGLDIAWFLIKADRGYYSFNTENIELEGNAEVFGYLLNGELTEWISAEGIVYDSQNGQVRSNGPAVYEGRAGFKGRPARGRVTAELDLSDVKIDLSEPLFPSYKTPIRYEELRPPYDPPDALRFLTASKEVKS